MQRSKNIIVGEHSYGDIRIEGISRGKINIGKYTSLGKNITAFMAYDHNINNISAYPFGHRKLPITKLMKPPLPTRGNYNLMRRSRLFIGNDVWIGSNAVLFSGITIGDGAAIGAYSIVTKDIPPYSVVVGHSRIIRKRFSDEDIEFLLKLKWWNFEDEVVANLGQILCSPNIKALRAWAKENKGI